VRGLLYFGLSPESASAARADWRALRKAAGTGEVVGFGQYWMPCSRARTGGIPRNAPPGANCSLEVTVQQDRTRATSEPYPAPSSEGVVTVFDSHDDLCPRFGRPSVQIVAELRAARAPGVTSSDIPACSETVGLLPVSSLERVFPTQERDREWAEAAEALILRRLSEAPALKLSELGVECRDTICHIHLAFPDKQYQQGTGNRLAADALNALPGFASGGAIIPSDTDSTMDYFFQRRKLPATTAAQISSN
jgi:hypothetical protein